MSWPSESKSRLMLLFFTWPAATLVGWLTARVTHTDWPAAAFPTAWLGVLWWTLSHHARESPRD